MRMLVGFVAGAIVGAVVVALLLGGAARPAERRRDGVWRERAETYERDLAATRRQRDTIAEELRRLTERFEALAARFEALAAVTPAPSGRPAVPASQWDALVTGEVNAAIARRLAARFPAHTLEPLLERVQAARDASRTLVATASVAGAADQARLEADRSAILAQVDAAFRGELGIGLAEFMGGVDPPPPAR